MKKGIYLGACRAYHPNYNIDYNDIIKGYHINVIGDMLEINLEKYDYIIATPPCNYYSRANYRRESSEYSQKTKHLLPGILEKLGKKTKPFIVENVRSPKIFEKEGIFKICDKYNIYIYIIGRHTYFTNIMINLNCKQEIDFHKSEFAKKNNIKTERQNYRQGGDNVHKVLEIWLKYINEE